MEKKRATKQISPAPSWLYRYELHKIQTNAITTISRNLELVNTEDEPSFDAFINVFDSQIVNAAVEEDKDCSTSCVVASLTFAGSLILIGARRSSQSKLCAIVYKSVSLLSHCGSS